jgi:hypothetical protein
VLSMLADGPEGSPRLKAAARGAAGTGRGGGGGGGGGGGKAKAEAARLGAAMDKAWASCTEGADEMSDEKPWTRVQSGGGDCWVLWRWVWSARITHDREWPLTTVKSYCVNLTVGLRGSEPWRPKTGTSTLTTLQRLSNGSLKAL